jgi:hypothetical protein
MRIDPSSLPYYVEYWGGKGAIQKKETNIQIGMRKDEPGITA